MALRSRISRQNMRHSLLLSVCSLLCLDISSTNDPYHQAIIAWEYRYMLYVAFLKTYIIIYLVFQDLLQYVHPCLGRWSNLTKIYVPNAWEITTKPTGCSIWSHLEIKWCMFCLYLPPSTQHAMVTTRMTCFFVQESLFINLHLPSVCEK